jgi:anti-anti-sigma factor
MRSRLPAESPKLHIELVCLMNGSLVRMNGELVVQTLTALWGVESLLVNEARVTFDLLGVTSIDSAGLEAVLGLMDSVRGRGGKVVIGCAGLRVDRPARWSGEFA